jgi:hypothetical protein
MILFLVTFKSLRFEHIQHTVIIKANSAEAAVQDFLKEYGSWL